MSEVSGTHLVLKFGGTSLGDTARIQAAARLVRSHSSAGTPVVVVSAMGSTTDTLVAAGEAAEYQRVGEGTPAPPQMSSCSSGELLWPAIMATP